MPETYTKDDVLFFVTAANIIGQMEANDELIYVEDDEALTDFLIEEYKTFIDMDGYGYWPEYIEDRAREVLAIWRE